jgi:hypothetical protein
VRRPAHWRSPPDQEVLLATANAPRFARLASTVRGMCFSLHLIMAADRRQIGGGEVYPQEAAAHAARDILFQKASRREGVPPDPGFCMRTTARQ